MKLEDILTPYGQDCRLPSLVDFTQYLLLAFISQWCSYSAVGKLRSGLVDMLDKIIPIYGIYLTFPHPCCLLCMKCMFSEKNKRFVYFQVLTMDRVVMD